MSILVRLWLSLGFVALGVASGVGARAAEEPAGDLHPLPPVTRSVFGNNQQFRMYGRGMTQAFSADGKTLFLNGHQGLTFWDFDDAKSKQPRNLRLDNNNNIYFHNSALALSPDGKMVAASSMMGGNQDMPILFFDAVTGKEIRQIENDQQIRGLSFSPDGRLLAVATQQRIELWDAANGDEVRVFPVAQNTFYTLFTFSPDGKMLAAVNNPNRFPAAAEDAAAELHVWETASGKERTCIRFPAPMPREQNPRVYLPNRGINGLAFSVDGRFLAASGSDSAVHFWDLHTGKEAVPLTGFDGDASALVFTTDGKELVAMSNNGSRLSWRTEEIRRVNSVRLAPLSESAFADLWKELAQADLFRTYRAGRHLLADPQRAVALLGAQLKPVPPGDTARLNKLAADLGSGDAALRRKAMMELRAKHGEAAVGALRQNQNPQRNAFGMTFEQKLINLYNTPERARDLKAVRILEEIGTPQARQVLEKLSKGAAGVSLTLESKAALDRLAAAKTTPRSLPADNLWNDLGGDDAVQAYRVMGSLAVTPKKAVSLLGERLKPVAVVEEKELAPLLANLESDNFPTREKASEALEKAGEQAVPVLKKALDRKPTLEARKRIERLLERLTQQTPAVVLQSLRAIEVLENVGTADAKHVLLSLSGGAPQAQITREAKASLLRLAKR